MQQLCGAYLSHLRTYAANTGGQGKLSQFTYFPLKTALTIFNFRFLLKQIFFGKKSIKDNGIANNNKF